MSMPSSISAFSYVLKNPDGSGFASAYLSPQIITIIINAIESAKWAVLFISLVTLLKKSPFMRDAEIFCLLLVVMCKGSNFTDRFIHIKILRAMVPGN